MSTEFKTRIQTAISAFATKDIKTAAEDFWAVLGYQSERRLEPSSYSFEQFQDTFRKYQIRADKAQAESWTQIHLLYQMTDEEIKEQLSENLQIQIDGIRFNSFQEQNMRSYLFVALQLCEDNLSRTRLASITREINRCFAMPVLLLIKTDQMLHISIIYRRRNRIQPNKDVLEKVTIIKDIAYRQATHRAHIEILSELSLSELSKKHEIQSFDQLHKAWEHTLDLKELNKKFYKELSNWFFWASQEVNFPDASEPNPENRNAIGLIRMLTRIIFVWFMKEKGLIPETLFDKNNVDKIIKYEDTNDSAYYKAILQNLFFATLNTEMNRDNPGSRRFRAPITGYQNPDFNVHNLFRYQKLFKTPETVIETYFDAIPFLNGSLFECLDQEHRIGGRVEKIYLDGFSDRNDNPLKVPDSLFWMSQEQDCDLNAIYGTKNKRYKVKGLLDILHSYKFTIAENTPIEEEIALDPELLGRVFENLLAAFNPETRSTARKQTGSYYTPREIVEYMVNQSLIVYLCNIMEKNNLGDRDTIENDLSSLILYTDTVTNFIQTNANTIINAIDNIRIIDPACGSGAFPMGLLLKMVYILHKLDPDNKKWKSRQLTNLKKGFQLSLDLILDPALKLEVASKMDQAIVELERTFDDYDVDYSRKLYLIQRCIYGVDIQPIAIQISQLRFYISLLVEQEICNHKKNIGIESLPNLENNLIAANSLVPLGIDQQTDIFQTQDIDKYKTRIRNLHKDYFNTRTREKKKALQEEEELLRSQLSKSLQDQGIHNEYVSLITSWNPYSMNKHSKFFDPVLMFGLDKFDIVIGNPPYVESRSSLMSKSYKDQLQNIFRKKYPDDIALIPRGADLFVYFMVLSVELVSDQGVSCLITQNSWLFSKYGQGLSAYLLKYAKVKNIVDSEFKYFDTIQINTIISIITSLKSNNKLISFDHYQTKYEELPPRVRRRIVSNKDSILKDYIWGIQLSDYDLIPELKVLKKHSNASRNEQFTVGQGLNLDSDYYAYIDDTDKCGVTKQYLLPIMTQRDGSVFKICSTKTYLIHSNYKGEQDYVKKLFDPGFSKRIPASFILPRGIGRHFACSNEGLVFSDSYVEIYSNKALDEISKARIFTFLNCSLFWLIREIMGRKNLGGGMLKAEAVDIKSIPFYFDFSDNATIINVSNELYKRQANKTVDEIASKEHSIIDNIIMNHLGFDKNKSMRIKNALIEAINRRENKAKT